MGKKGKANKLAKMSEEERARYNQMRADMEEEARRRKMQLIALYLKNKLKREEAFCRLNLAKINQEWRSILRQTKCQELRCEMQQLEQYLKDCLERKDHIIKRLLNDLTVCEESYATLQVSHMETIKTLISLQQQRLHFLRDTYEDDKRALLKDCEEDFADFKGMRDRAQVQLECVLYQLEDKSRKEIETNHERHLERLDDIKSGMQLRLEQITQQGEEKLERLWQSYQDVLSGYVSHTEGFYAEYMDLKERDEESTAIIRDHCREIEAATDQLAHLKLVAADSTEKFEFKINYLTKVKDDLSERFNNLKQQEEEEMATSTEKFNKMCVISYDVLKKLKKIVAKGATLLQLSGVCQKLQTDKEKLLPLGLPPISKTILEHDESVLSELPAALMEDSFCNWRKMENFWRRVNNAKLDVSGLVRQKRSLQSENEKLKVELQQRLIELNLSNGTNAHVNDYLAKRPSSMCVNRVKQVDLEPRMRHSADAGRRFGRINTMRASCLEANLTNAVRSRMLVKGKPKLAKIEAIVAWN